MKSSQGESDFIENGVEVIEEYVRNLLATRRTELMMLIVVPLDTYKYILQSVYRKRPLLSGKKDGTNRKLVFDHETKLFRDASDGRVIALMSPELIAGGGPSSNFGHEMQKRLHAGDRNPKLFEYDEAGRYIGVKVDGKLMAPEKLAKGYPECLSCGKESTKHCGQCKIAIYCSAECQLQDWPAHKAMCGRM